MSSKYCLCLSFFQFGYSNAPKISQHGNFSPQVNASQISDNNVSHIGRLEY